MLRCRAKHSSFMIKFYTTTVLLSLLFTLVYTENGHTQSFDDLDKSPLDISYFRENKVTPPLVKVVYGRPKVNEKKVFGNTVPYDKIWRTGANEATEVKFYKDVQFGKTKVKAGTYVLLTIPRENEWKIILSSKLDVWGAFQYDPSFDIASIIVPVQKAEFLDVFSIAFKEKENHILMVLGWDDTRVRIPLQFKREGTLVKM